jgi:NAD(P)-dependent dehydrogenase (short-subunit alcohol dehydrogenase family)
VRSTVNVASAYAVNMRAGMGRRDVAKAGVPRRRASLAAEETKQGIRVNAAAPAAR